MKAKAAAAVVIAGVLFSVGLGISGMLIPSKVVGFLNIFGRWDPSLAGVMGGGILVAFFVFRRQRTMSRPYLSASFDMPTRTQITPSLVIGSAMFGVGWGMMGYCPGPAVSSLVTGSPEVILFFVAIVAGMLAHRVAAPLWTHSPSERLEQRSVDA